MTIDLFDHVHRFVELTEAQKTVVSGLISTHTVQRREHLFRAGARSSPLTFVSLGLARLYSTDKKGVERTLQFGLEGWWLADWNSFRRGEPTEFSWQAVEDSTVVTVSHENYETLLQTVVPLERYFRNVYERIADHALRHIHDGETRSAEELYRRFQKEHPDFLQRIPQYMLASCLGFTPEFLSMIRARKSPSKVRS